MGSALSEKNIKKKGGRKRMSETEPTSNRYKNIRIEGLGRIYKPRWKRRDGTFYESPNWRIGFYHRSKEIRESSQSEREADAKKLLKRKVTSVESGKVIPREDKV